MGGNFDNCYGQSYGQSYGQAMDKPSKKTRLFWFYTVHCRMWYQKVLKWKDMCIVNWHHKRKDTLAGTRLCSFAQWQFWWTNDVESGKNKNWRGLNRGNFTAPQHSTCPISFKKVFFQIEKYVGFSKNLFWGPPSKYDKKFCYKEVCRGNC